MRERRNAESRKGLIKKKNSSNVAENERKMKTL
jgi:hypothetical protein